MKLIVLLGVAACGRVGFDPITNGNPLGGGDAASSTGGDARPIDAGPAGGSAMPDAQPFACANALNLQLAARLTTSTCVGGDHVDGCGPPSTQEVVFEFVAPASDAGASVGLLTLSQSAVDPASSRIDMRGDAD